MKLTAKIIDQVINEAVGEDVVPLVREIKNKKNISEFKIAEALKQEVNKTRNMLYRLYDVNLVSFIRKKDKKKGWYIYYWTFNLERVKFLVTDLKKKRIERLKDRIDREQESDFFSCVNKCMRLDFDQSTEFEFKCPECGEIMNQEDNKEKIADLEKEMKSLEKELNKK